MNIHPIKTENDYDAALSEIERLWGSKEGTESGDKLDILLVLVNPYAEELTKTVLVCALLSPS